MKYLLQYLVVCGVKGDFSGTMLLNQYLQHQIDIYTKNLKIFKTRAPTPVVLDPLSFDNNTRNGDSLNTLFIANKRIPDDN